MMPSNESRIEQLEVLLKILQQRVRELEERLPPLE